MRTRAGLVYPRVDKRVEKRRRDSGGGGKPAAKKWKPAEYDGGNIDFFDSLHDDLVVTILCKLSSSASCPADFVNVLSTCKRFNGLALRSMVLSKASTKMLSIKAKNWSESAHRFLKFCADAGNIEACYILGMIRFYCLQNRGSGASLMAKAAIGSHAPALYSLAVIQFNGSGGQKCDKDLRAGVALCARAAFLGHIDALRELGHCLQDGYGVEKNFSEGRRFLVQANARELASVLASYPDAFTTGSWLTGDLLHQDHVTAETAGGLLYTDFGCNVPVLETHPANRFLTEWFKDRGDGSGLGLSSGLRQCSHMGCGRPETRKHEFRRCSVCGAVNYCSRACQALDWKMRHKAECVAVERWLVDDNGVAVANVGPVDGVNGGGEFNGNVDGNEDLMVVDS